MVKERGTVTGIFWNFSTPVQDLRRIGFNKIASVIWRIVVIMAGCTPCRICEVLIISDIWAFNQWHIAQHGFIVYFFPVAEIACSGQRCVVPVITPFPSCRCGIGMFKGGYDRCIYKSCLMAATAIYSRCSWYTKAACVLDIFYGMDGIPACPVDMAVTAIYCPVMFLFWMTVLTEWRGITWIQYRSCKGAVM